MSLLCPIDFRYGRPQMKRIFEEEARLQRLLDVESALARAESKVGLVPREAAAEITKKATTKLVTVKRVEELERETRHDLMAVVLALTEACAGDAGNYVHLGATSNDIQDSATALQLRDAIRVIEEGLDGLVDAFADLATKHKKTIMLGRTHGQAAVPITFGLKVAVFASEVARQRERMRQATPRIVVGKMSGAVGTGAAFGPRALDIQTSVMTDLGIGFEEAATQVVGRDRHAEFIGILANLAASLEKFCTEVRNLQRTEIGEVAEAFESRSQVGSSDLGAAFGPRALDIQTSVMTDLGIGFEEAATQVVGRDRHAEFIGILANLAASLEKFCTEVRNLQRTEIGEVAEAFESRSQVGSSTMAQKENPVAAENVCSLARIVRSLVTPALENVPLWHERDLTNSAAERILLPHACVLIDEMVAKTTEVFRTLRVFPGRMKANLEATQGQVMAEAAMMALVAKGLGRQEAHKLVRDAAHSARTNGTHLREALLAEARISKLLSKSEIETAMNPTTYLGQSASIIDATLKRLR